MSNEFPSNWELGRFRDVLRESRLPGTNGETARKLTVRLYGKGVVPKLNDRGSKATVYYRRKAGQFIYSKLDFLNGAFGIIPQELDGYESTADLPCFDVRGQVDPRWLLEHVSRPAFYKRYRGSAIGSRKAQRVSPSEFLASRVTFPPLPEQMAIAKALKRVSAAIEASASLVDELRAAKRNAMRQLLTQGHPKFQTEMTPIPWPWRMGRVAPRIEEIPAHWELVKLIDVARLESGHTPSRKHAEYWDGDIPWLSLADTDQLKRLRIESTTERITPKGVANSSARLLPAESVVLSRTAVRGLCSTLAEPMTTSQDFVVFVCGERLDSRYLMQLFRHMQREWRRLEQGSSPTNKTLYFRVFRKVKILLPPLGEQQAIGRIGDSFDARIEAEQDGLHRLEELKRGLAAELLSGRIRLPAELIGKLNDSNQRASE